MHTVKFQIEARRKMILKTFLNKSALRNSKNLIEARLLFGTLRYAYNVYPRVSNNREVTILNFGIFSNIFLK